MPHTIRFQFDAPSQHKLGNSSVFCQWFAYSCSNSSLNISSYLKSPQGAQILLEFRNPGSQHKTLQASSQNQHTSKIYFGSHFKYDFINTISSFKHLISRLEKLPKFRSRNTNNLVTSTRSPRPKPKLDCSRIEFLSRSIPVRMKSQKWRKWMKFS